jgi:uncharacterized protein YcfL
MKYLRITLLISLVLLGGCSAHTGINRAPYEQKLWWGNKQAIIDFLNSPETQSVKTWQIESLD